MAADIAVHVPQEEGEIRLSIAGADAAVYEVVDHIVQVTESDLEHFLSVVDEARRAPEHKPKPKTGSATEGK